MADLETFELLLRGAAAGIFFGLGVLALAAGRRAAQFAAALFSFGAAAHVLTQMPALQGALGALLVPVFALSAMSSGFFWLFARELFQDRARFSLVGLLPAALLLGSAVGAQALAPQLAAAMLVIHNGLSAFLVMAALWLIARGWREDLVEARRRLRGPFLATAAVYALGVITVQFVEVFAGSQGALSPIGAFALAALALGALFGFAALKPDLFAPPAAVPAPAAAPLERPAEASGDPALSRALEAVMRNDKVYRAEGLTIGRLAARLGVPEYRLRRHINGTLGFRNFSAYLSFWRLTEAKAALADPAQREVSIATIGLDAGYQSLGPFNRAFKAETGLTPSEFRARALADSKTG